MTNKANRTLYRNSKIVAVWTRAAIIPTTSRVLSPFWGFLAQKGCWCNGISPAEATKMACRAPDVQAEAEGRGLIQP